MQHPDAADLAVLALGDHLDEDGLYEHITDCDRCTAELTDLRVVVSRASAAGGPGPGPSAHVWSAIVAEIGPEMDGVPAAERLAATFADPVLLGAAEDNFVLDGLAIPIDPAAVQLNRRDEVAARRDRPADRSAGPAGRAGIDPSPQSSVAATGIPAARDLPRAGSGTDTGNTDTQNTDTGTGTGNRDTGSMDTGWDRRSRADGGDGADPAGRSAAGPRRRRWLPLAAAAVIGVVAGGGVVALVAGREPDRTVLASTALTPVAGGQLSGDVGRQFGTAELVEANGTRWVTVSGAALPATSDSYEVWLMGTGDLIVSLGALHDGAGTFTVPDGIDIDQYPLVDISAEPPDGIPTHSGDSLVRGTL